MWSFFHSFEACSTLCSQKQGYQCMIKLINQSDNFYIFMLLLTKAIRNVFQIVGKCKKTLMNADKCSYHMRLYLLWKFAKCWCIKQSSYPFYLLVFASFCFNIAYTQNNICRAIFIFIFCRFRSAAHFVILLFPSIHFP